MTDIVERLRHTAPIVPVCGKAADEIERLRMRVADLEDQLLQALGERPKRRGGI